MLTSNVTTAQTISPALDDRLHRVDQNERMRVLVQMRRRVRPETFQRSTRARQQMIETMRRRTETDQRPLRLILEQEGVTDVTSLWINNTLAVSATPAVIRRLARSPQVVGIRPDEVVTMGSKQPAGEAGPSWHLDAVGAPWLWSLGFDGTGIVVASMDTGVDVYHPDLGPRWRGGDNSWKDVHNQYSLPHDYDGHGTATMGIMVGGWHSGDPIGAAPGAQWIAVKIFDDNGNALYSKIHEGFQWLLDPDGDPNTADAPDVVNNSWGLHDAVNKCIDEFQHDIDMLKAAGIAVVFAAGNAGPAEGTSVSPANHPSNLSVGAIRTDGSIAFFSSRGPAPCSGAIFPSLTAPGMSIRSADLTGDGAILDSYADVSGTSHAAALVSGGLAVLMSAFPAMEAARLERALVLSAFLPPGAAADNAYGHGMLNLPAAYALAASARPEDLDGDFAFGLSDLVVLADEWLFPACVYCRGDLNNDGVVNLSDFAHLAAYFGQ